MGAPRFTSGCHLGIYWCGRRGGCVAAETTPLFSREKVEWSLSRYPSGWSVQAGGLEAPRRLRLGGRMKAAPTGRGAPGRWQRRGCVAPERGRGEGEGRSLGLVAFVNPFALGIEGFPAEV